MRVLFLNVPLHGHINPTLDLVTELVSSGNEIVYYASPSFCDKIEATGAEFRFGFPPSLAANQATSPSLSWGGGVQKLRLR